MTVSIKKLNFNKSSGIGVYDFFWLPLYHNLQRLLRVEAHIKNPGVHELLMVALSPGYRVLLPTLWS